MSIEPRDLTQLVRWLDARYQKKYSGATRGVVTESDYATATRSVKVRLLGDADGVERTIPIVGSRPMDNDSVHVSWLGPNNPIVVGTIGEDPWHEIGASGEPAFENGWTNYGSWYETAAFCRINGIVHIKGLIKSGTLDTTAFTLPTGYRPAARPVFAEVTSPNTIGRLDITTAGVVKPVAGSNAWFSVNCSFRAEQ